MKIKKPLTLQYDTPSPAYGYARYQPYCILQEHSQATQSIFMSLSELLCPAKLIMMVLTSIAIWCLSIMHNQLSEK